MSIDFSSVMRGQLEQRRGRVVAAISSSGPDPQLTALLSEVDAALERFESGTYGLCEVCHDTVEADRLISNPLERFCLDHLNARERRALEDDLNLASQVQLGLLPDRGLRFHGWRFDYCYEPAGPVSGDYVDIVKTRESDVYFALGDVSGKGVAASMLMAKLHAVFRSLISLKLGVDQLIERAGRLFGESTLPGQYATLICGHASKDGEIHICNAGHPPALLIRGGRIEPISATGLPLGMFPDQKFSISRVTLQAGDSLLLYTDGVLDTLNGTGEEYGMSRLMDITTASQSMPPDQLVSSCLADVSTFRRGTSRFDDITMMGIRREPI
ncbi:MAG TPA: PP2C family protein-serine/threonine phosphatase [Terriglobia bacterium]|nr:PP2C family protein-serine/threonine phosphatase [Terriglobia bacterium]